MKISRNAALFDAVSWEHAAQFDQFSKIKK